MPTARPFLADFLRTEIARRGPLTFHEFMETALYAPELGYYSSGRGKIGRRGDYFTNVSVGSLFGTLLARQFLEMWEQLGRPERFTLVEQGASRGELASDVLAALEQISTGCSRSVELVIIEPIQTLRLAQGAALAGRSNVHWISALADLEPFTGVHFSNELLDAMPVHAVVRRGGAWLERYVDEREGTFVLTDGPLSRAELQEHLARLPATPDVYETEVNLAALDWISALAGKVDRGFVLALDYGFPRREYYRPDRTTGTLTGYAEHRRQADLLARPGEIDLTAHVEFTSLAERGEASGLKLTGFADQHHFMVGLGRLHFHDTDSLDTAKRAELRAFQTLMHPTLLGRAFHAICFAKGVELPQPLAGFHFASDPRTALFEDGT